MPRKNGHAVPSVAPRAIAFRTACAQYVHRFTMEHVPRWAQRPNPGTGQYYAPQFVSDREWYTHTRFPGERGYIGEGGSCYTTGQTWPIGHWLDRPYTIARGAAAHTARTAFFPDSTH